MVNKMEDDDDDLFTYHVSAKAQAFVSEEEDEDEHSAGRRGSPDTEREGISRSESLGGKRRSSEVPIEVLDNSPNADCKRIKAGKDGVQLVPEEDALEDGVVRIDCTEDDLGDAFVRELLGGTPCGQTAEKKTDMVHGLTPEYARLRAAVMKRELALKSISDEDQSDEVVEVRGIEFGNQSEEVVESPGCRIFVICNYPASVDRFSIRLKDSVGKLLTAIRQVGERNNWIRGHEAYTLVKNNRSLNLDSSIEDAGLENEDVVELRIDSVEEANVRLVCQCSHGREAFRLRLADKIRCLFDGFIRKAVQHGWCKPAATFKFTWDGDVLTGEERVDSLDASEDDIIEVFIT